MKRMTVLVASLLALAGCSTQVGGHAEHAAPSAQQVQEEPSPENATTAPSTVPAPPEPELAETNVRGNYESEIGLVEQVFVVATGVEVLTFVVDDIVPGFECNGPYSDPSENGHFVAVTMTFSTTDLSELYGNLHVSGYDFQVIGADGTIENDSNTFATYTCLHDSMEFPSGGMGQGVSATATFVLDTKHASGLIVFRPYFMSGEGWEYKF